MRTIEGNLYQFPELNKNAQERAIEDWRAMGFEYSWLSESIDSVKAFCDLFGIKVTDYTLGTYGHSSIETSANPEDFRGLKLKDFKTRDWGTLTGYCLDYTLGQTFIDGWTRSGNAFHAFREAIDAACSDIIRDMEYQDSDEAIADALTINEYEFTEDGERA